MRRIGPVLGAATALCLGILLLAIGVDVPAVFDRSIVLTASGVAAIGLGILVWHQHRSDAESRDTQSTGFPDRNESVGATTSRIVGDQIDQVVRAESDEVGVSRRRIRNDLRLAVETALVRRLDLSPAEATTRVSEGTWTDDPRAASLLGDAEHRSRSIRFRDWLVDKRHYRCVRATLRELEAIGQPAPGLEPPDERVGAHRTPRFDGANGSSDHRGPASGMGSDGLADERDVATESWSDGSSDTGRMSPEADRVSSESRSVARIRDGSSAEPAEDLETAVSPREEVSGNEGVSGSEESR